MRWVPPLVCNHPCPDMRTQMMGKWSDTQPIVDVIVQTSENSHSPKKFPGNGPSRGSAACCQPTRCLGASTVLLYCCSENGSGRHQMKAWHRITHWRWRSSKWSKSKTPPEGLAQDEEETTSTDETTPADDIVLRVRELEGVFPRVRQVQPNGNREEEETKIDPSRQSYRPKESTGEDYAEERLLRKQQQLVRTGDEEMIQELRASLLKLHDNLRRNDAMAAARLESIEDEKAALEVALREERAKTAMQQKTMHCLRQANVQAQSVEIELRNQVEALQIEKKRQGLSHTKKEKIRSGLARLVENDLRRQVAMLTQSRRLQADEIRSLLTQLQVKLYNWKLTCVEGLSFDPAARNKHPDI